MLPMRDEDFVRRGSQNAHAGSDDETQPSTCRTKNRNYALQLNNGVNYSQYDSIFYREWRVHCVFQQLGRDRPQLANSFHGFATVRTGSKNS